MIMSEALMQYTCLDSMRVRVEELWPELKEKLIQNIREQLIHFDPTVYANIFRTYSVLDAHLVAMEAARIKKQQLAETFGNRSPTSSNRSLLAGSRSPASSNRSLLASSKAQNKSLPSLAARKKPAKKDSYVDILQK